MEANDGAQQVAFLLDKGEVAYIGSPPAVEPWRGLVAALCAAPLAERVQVYDQALAAMDGDATAIRAAVDAELLQRIARKQDRQQLRHPGPGWLDYAQIIEALPLVAWYVKGLIPVAAFVIFFGDPATLKSLFLQALVLFVALGREFLRKWPGLESPVKAFECKRAPVLFLDQDSGMERIRRRFRALHLGNAIGDGEHPELFSISFPQVFNILEAEHVAWLKDAILNSGAGLVVIDNLSAILGGLDENNPEVTPALANVKAIINDTGATVIMVHHRSKITGSRAQTLNSSRGHSSIAAAADYVYLVDRNPRKRDDEKNNIRISAMKCRDFEVPTFEARFEAEQEADGVTLKTARFWGLGEPEAALSAEEQARLCIARELDGERNQSAVVNLVIDVAGIQRGSTLKAIKKMVAAGELIESNGPNNSKLYRLPEE